MEVQRPELIDKLKKSYVSIHCNANMYAVAVQLFRWILLSRPTRRRLCDRSFYLSVCHSV